LPKINRGYFFNSLCGKVKYFIEHGWKIYVLQIGVHRSALVSIAYFMKLELGLQHIFVQNWLRWHFKLFSVSIGGIPTTAYITSPAGVSKIRPKSVQLPAKPRPRSGSIVIPMTPNQLASGNAGATQTLTNLPSVQGVQLKTAVHSSKSNLHIKQDSSKLKLHN
jgi:hypothetical protein